MKELKDMTIEELWRLFPIALEKHNTDYAAWYNEEKEKLARVLRELNIYRVNHIGSTAVKGLVAKPIVDILLELPENYDVNIATDLLQNDGWILMRQDIARKTIDLNKGYTPNGFAKKVYHLHVKPAGDWGELYFRDFLRQNPDVARQYEALKKSLLEQFKYNRDAYTEAKTAFITGNTEKARKEYAGRYAPYLNSVSN